MASINETIIEAQVVEALRSCFDPEIPVNIYELGLVYEVKVSAEGAVTVQMTLTSPHCPAVQSLPAEIESKVRAVDGVSRFATKPRIFRWRLRPSLFRKTSRRKTTSG